MEDFSMYKYECASCGGRVSARFDFCSKCAKQFSDLYGDQWPFVDWIISLRDSQRYMISLEIQETKTLDADSIYARASSVSIEDWSASTDIDGKRISDMGMSNHYVLPNSKRKNDLDVKIASYVRQGYGSRKIHKLLTAEYGDKVPSLRTLERRVKEYRGKE